MTALEFVKTYGPVIAREYESMLHRPGNPAVVNAYHAFIGETLEQWDSMRQAITVEPWTLPGQAYATSQEMFTDVHERRHMFVFMDGAPDSRSHPMNAIVAPGWTINQVFRAVHDYYGHFLSGGGFGPSGEELTYRQHARLYSDAALPALCCETRAQSLTFYFGKDSGIPAPTRPFPAQKVGILSGLAVLGGIDR